MYFSAIYEHRMELLARRLAHRMPVIISPDAQLTRNSTPDTSGRTHAALVTVRVTCQRRARMTPTARKTQARMNATPPSGVSMPRRAPNRLMP